jgi:tetratricopeptide (TPR) repeat protein
VALSGVAHSEPENPLREHHDTWSGVAPPAKVKALEEILGKPTPPMRVGGSTVLGLGTPTDAPPKPNVVEEVRFQDGMRLQEERLQERGLPVRRDYEDSLPPETRGYEEGESTVLVEVPSQPAPSPKVTVPIEPPKPVESPVVPPSPPATPVKTALSATLQSNVPFEVMGSEPAILASAFAIPDFPRPEPGKPEPAKPEPAKPEAKARVSAQSDAVSEPPTKRWSDLSPHRKMPEEGIASAEEITRPHSRPHALKSDTVKPKSRPWGLVLLSVVLLSGGLYAGMQLVGTKPGPKGSKPQDATALPMSSPMSPSVASTSETRGETPSETSWSTIEESLEAGDYDAANGKLEALTPSAKATPEYRRYRILADAMGADLLWWQIRLLPKSESGQMSLLEASLATKLSALSQLLDVCRPLEDCKAKTQSADWAFFRMQGMPDKAQRPKQGTVDATGLYQLAMLDWVKAPSPEGKTLERLMKARLPGIEQGPRVTALIVALIDSKRFDEARAELAKLAQASKVHPHFEALNQYLKRMDSTSASDAGVTESDTEDSDAQDPDLKEPDFRIRLQRAAGCLARNELTKAQKLYRSVLAQRPSDIEALTGAADVLRRRGSLAQARSQYDKVLGINGSYLPALIGAAEVRWNSGDRSGAVAMYRRVVERVGEGPGYGQQAANRIKEYEGAKPESNPPSDKAKTDSESSGLPKPSADDLRKAP